MERVREIGLLRAVGMHRGQVRSMIRWEATVIATFATTLGLGLGTFVGWATTRTVDASGAGIPLLELGVCTGAAIVAGTLVTIVPAHRAARVNLIRALTTE
jgi:putative ABC transport system permease protein